MNKFKAGDKVYVIGKTEIFTLPNCNKKGILSFKIENGFRSEEDSYPSMFHATKENKAKLEALFGVEFEEPEPTGSDLTRKLLSEGKHVLCWVSDESDKDAIALKDCLVIINKILEEGSFSGTGIGWKFAVPHTDYAEIPNGVLTPFQTAQEAAK